MPLEPALVSRIRPISAKRDRLLPLLNPLCVLFPGGGLQRGAVVGIDPGEVPRGIAAGARRTVPGAGGATTLGFALLAAASSCGAWCAAVGTADPGILSVAELGIDLARLALVPVWAGLGSAWPEVTATLIDGMDAILLRLPWPARAQVVRRLSARARERQTALIVLGPPKWWGEGPDLLLKLTGGEWHGIGTGHGHLQGRRVQVTATGRRSAARPVTTTIWLPSLNGRVSEGADQRSSTDESYTYESYAYESCDDRSDK